MSNLDPPPGLDQPQRQIWADTIAQLLEAGTIARIDLNSLTAYVSAVRTHQRATQLLTESDILINRDGRPVPNPALQIQKDTAQIIASFARQFRLNAHQPGKPPDQPAIHARPAKRDEHDDHPGRWCEDHHRWECTGDRKSGRGACHGVATAAGLCRMHLGKGGTAKRLVAELVRMPTYGAPVKVSAEEALLGELWRTAGHVKWLGERVAELEASALTWGQGSTVTRYFGEFPGSETVEKAGPHVLLDLYDRERKHLVHTAAEIIRAGLAERLTRVAETQGAAMARVVQAILGDLELTAEQQELVPVVVPRRFRELLPAAEAL